MTRENKLALVLGFGLLLVVAVLISDHFSSVREQRAAQLLPADDPLADARRNDPTLVAFDSPGPRPGAGSSHLAASRDTIPNPSEASHPTLNMPNLQATEHQVLGAQPHAQAGRVASHEVRPNETLSGICVRYYDDTSLVQELASFNDLPDPNSVRLGTRLKIPDASLLRPGGSRASNPGLAAPREAPPQTAGYRSYTIKENDKLWNVAKSLLGSGTRYKELAELNRDLIPDPDDLTPGTVIRVPRT